MSAPPTRMRLLVAATTAEDASWAAWVAVRNASPQASQIVLQRVSHKEDPASQPAAGLGYGETLRWFGPITDDHERRLVIDYVQQVLAAGAFPPVAAELQRLARTAKQDGAPPASRSGMVLLSHAETDVLVLRRALEELPAGFPPVSGYSLNRIATATELREAVRGSGTGTKLVAIVRVHGEPASVPGLLELVDEAQRDGWHVVVISGVNAPDADGWPRTSAVSSALAADLTRYFMAGGIVNIAQAIRRVAHELLGAPAAYGPPQEMPAHGLYHPDLLVTSVEEWEGHRPPNRPVGLILFYRAHVLSGNLQFIDDLVRALEMRGFAAIAVFTSSLREKDASGGPAALGLLPPPAVVVNTVSYPVLALTSLELPPEEAHLTAFERMGIPVVQVICCGTTRADWSQSGRGLGPAEAAMNVALPECDGRVITVPVTFKENHRYVPDHERIGRVADFAARLNVLRTKANHDKRVAIVLSNSGGKAQQIGGAVGLDTPASLLRFLTDMRNCGYDVGALPTSADELMSILMARGCYDERFPADASSAWRLPRTLYFKWFNEQSQAFKETMRGAWGEPQRTGSTLPPPFWRSGKQSLRTPFVALQEPNSDAENYLFSAVAFGKVLVAIQPPRGFGFDQETIYHSPDLPPCHHYAAFYRWLAQGWCSDALIHFGTHGTLEWLPGKALALSADCYPDALLGDLPVFYPFVINNPGEGAQAKRRTHAVIIDHLIPPLTQAQLYGPLAALARLVEEYYRAETLDPSKLVVLRTQIWSLVKTERLEEDLQQIRQERHADHVHSWDDRMSEQGVPRGLESLSGRGFAHLLEDLDAYLCDLGRAQIRNGLHVFGVAPAGAELIDLVFAVLHSANGVVPSIVEAAAQASGISLADSRGRTEVEQVARNVLERLAERGFSIDAVDLVVDACRLPEANTEPLRLVLQFACNVLVPNLRRTTDETKNLLAALAGRYVPAGPSGAPTRGMAHVLPTGRNFYTVDPRGLPTPAAWATGVKLADAALARYMEETRRRPESVALTVWGTPTMRTGGDEIAEALALIGVRPIWEPVTRRTCGLEVIPLADLGRPRIDVTLRISGFFRDAFPALIQLFDEAVQGVVVLDEPLEQNFPRKHWLAETAALVSSGVDQAAAPRRASYRVFSSKPGTYGTGVQELIESGSWREIREVGDAVIAWGGWAYGVLGAMEGSEAIDTFRRQLARVELTVHNGDNREQDLFDSSDHFEYQGGLVAAVSALTGERPRAYRGDSSNPAEPDVRTLQAEVLRVFRSRVVNPRWLSAMQRHGYRGGVEMVTTVESLFGLAATAGIITDWMFESVAESYAMGAGREFLERVNPWALNAIAARLLEAEQRQLWKARDETLQALRSVLLASEATMEEHAQ